MDYGDLILFPLFLIILSLFFRVIRKSYKDPLLRKYHRLGFWVKIIGCIVFCLYSVYLYPADSIGLYQEEGVNIYHLILKNSSHLHWLFLQGKNFDESFLKNPHNSGYFRSEGNYMVVKLVALLSFLSGGRYVVTSLFFACIAFSGIWKLFLFFYEQYPGMHKKLAIAILLFPSVVFWSSGVLKDTLCIASLGWITYSLYEIFYRKKHLFKNSIILLIFGYMLAVLKVYILICYAPFFMLFITLKNIQSIKNKFFKYLLAPFLIASCLLVFAKILTSYNDELGSYAVDSVTSSIQHLNDAFKSMDGDESAESNFNLGVEFDGTFKGLLKLAPAAIFTTFFRPFIWESHKISQLLASVESLLLLFLTLYVILKSGLFTSIKLVFSDPVIMYCFFFSIVFATFVGASTLNFGTLVRYKIPCLPFFVISLFLIYEKARARSSKKGFQISSPHPSTNTTLMPQVAT
jgi:hypothetical protein